VGGRLGDSYIKPPLGLVMVFKQPQTCCMGLALMPAGVSIMHVQLQDSYAACKQGARNFKP
jgi:hypothetical protein